MSGRRLPMHPMNAINPITPMDDVHMIGKLADLKDAHYKQSLMLSAISELLIEKGIITTAELQDRATRIDLLDNLDAGSDRSLQ